MPSVLFLTSPHILGIWQLESTALYLFASMFVLYIFLMETFVLIIAKLLQRLHLGVCGTCLISHHISTSQSMLCVASFCWKCAADFYSLTVEKEGCICNEWEEGASKPALLLFYKCYICFTPNHLTGIHKTVHCNLHCSLVYMIVGWVLMYFHWWCWSRIVLH